MPNIKVKYIIDENGDRVAPVTHIDAVRDSAGNGLSDLMVPEKLGSGIGTCSTSSGTALTVSLTDYDLVQNGFVAVTFENDVPANATLNINGKGAKPIYYKGSAIEADTIKADDTVMFCYDGTNYVVTSLGGGGGSVIFPEFVTISLSQTDGSDSDLIGATIVVTDDDTSETLLSTTWQGEAATLRIDSGIEYTVTVGNVIGYTVTNTQSYTAAEGLQRLITFNYVDATKVDLGLPSGRKWAVGNVVSDGNGGYMIGGETDRGAYISWGNITPHFSSNGSTFDDGYNWGSANDGQPYASTPGAAITSASYPNYGAVFAANSGYDAARELLGGTWRLPTADEYNELIQNTTSSWTTKNGVLGMEFTSKINGAKIFFRETKWGEGTSIVGPTVCFYACTSLRDSAYQYYLAADGNGVVIYNSNLQRFCGIVFRPVQ